jgi:hypothetical protein
VICIETNHVCIICTAKVDIKPYSTHFLISIESSDWQSEIFGSRTAKALRLPIPKQIYWGIVTRQQNNPDWQSTAKKKSG